MATDRYRTIQQEMVKTFCGPRPVAAACRTNPRGQRQQIPGLKHPPAAVMRTLMRFAHIASGDTFTAKDLSSKTASLYHRLSVNARRY